MKKYLLIIFILAFCASVIYLFNSLYLPISISSEINWFNPKGNILSMPFTQYLIYKMNVKKTGLYDVNTQQFIIPKKLEFTLVDQGEGNPILKGAGDKTTVAIQNISQINGYWKIKLYLSSEAWKNSEKIQQQRTITWAIFRSIMILQKQKCGSFNLEKNLKIPTYLLPINISQNIFNIFVKIIKPKLVYADWEVVCAESGSCYSDGTPICGCSGVNGSPSCDPSQEGVTCPGTIYACVCSSWQCTNSCGGSCGPNSTKTACVGSCGCSSSYCSNSYTCSISAWQCSSGTTCWTPSGTQCCNNSSDCCLSGGGGCSAVGTCGSGGGSTPTPNPSTPPGSRTCTVQGIQYLMPAVQPYSPAIDQVISLTLPYTVAQKYTSPFKYYNLSYSFSPSSYQNRTITTAVPSGYVATYNVLYKTISGHTTPPRPAVNNASLTFNDAQCDDPVAGNRYIDLWWYYYPIPTPSPTPSASPSPSPSPSPSSSPVPSATPSGTNWFQVQGGNVHTDGYFSQTITGTTKFAIADVSGKSGIVSYAGTSITSFGSSSNSPNFLINDTNYKNILSTSLYNYYSSLFATKANLLSANFIDANLTSGAVYLAANGLATNADLNIASKKIIIFVEGGQLQINHKIAVANGGYIIFIVKNNSPLSAITIGAGINHGSFVQSVTNKITDPDINGVFITDGTFETLSNSPAADTQLVIGGTVVANQITLNRKLANKTYPAELFVYRPDLWQNAPEELKAINLKWQEI